MSQISDGVRVIDSDSHLTEVYDLWTKRAPDAYRDRVPRVVEIDGKPTWIVEDGLEIGGANGGGVVNRHGEKHPFIESQAVWGLDEVHPGAFDVKARLEVLDNAGIWAQVTFPNNIGLGGQDLSMMRDPVLRQLCVEIYNDYLVEVQEESGGRLLPMPVMPAWDVDDCVREAERIHRQGLHGINMTNDPQDLGAPDLASPAWDPLWAACVDLQLPVHFHIGASPTTMNFYGQYYWESQDEYVKPAIGGTMLFIGNARMVTNTILCGMFDRNPGLKLVSVESGIGWIPFILEALDYEVLENAPEQYAKLTRKPIEYFRDHWYATYWFEKNQGKLPALVEAVGADNILFETDFPHPTCLFPKPLDDVAEAMAPLAAEDRRKILGENAAKLYRL